MWKSSEGNSLRPDNPWSSLQRPRPKHRSGWLAETSVSRSKVSPAAMDLLFLSTQMLGWGPAMHRFCNCRTTGQEGPLHRKPEMVQPSPPCKLPSISSLWDVSSSPSQTQGLGSWLCRVSAKSLSVSSSSLLTSVRHTDHSLTQYCLCIKSFYETSFPSAWKILSRWEKRNVDRARLGWRQLLKLQWRVSRGLELVKRNRQKLGLPLKWHDTSHRKSCICKPEGISG